MHVLAPPPKWAWLTFAKQDRHAMAGAGSYALVLLAALLSRCATRCAAAAVTYKSGPYSVVFQPDSLPTLQVLRQGTAEPVWYSPNTALPFVSVARVQQQITQEGGSFVFKFTTVEECLSVEITGNGTRQQHNQLYPQVYFLGRLCDKVSFELTFQAEDVPDDHHAKPWTHLKFNVTLMPPSLDYNQLRLSYGSEADEHIYGFGAQYSKFDMKGQNLPLFLSEQGVGRGLEPLSFVLDLLSPGAGKCSN